MPLNASNRPRRPEETSVDSEVTLQVEPAERAVEEGWNTAFVRSPSASTADQTRVGVIPAEKKRFVDDTVPLTTDTLSWRARHERQGSTAGPWTDWISGKPRNNPTFEGESFRERMQSQQTGSLPILTSNRRANKVITDGSTALLISRDTTSGAEIDVAGHDLQIGPNTLSYAAETITGLSNSSTYFVYVDDPDFSGSTAPGYTADLNSTNVVSDNDRYFVGDIRTPTDGSTSVGGSTGDDQLL